MERRISILPLLSLVAAGPAYAHGQEVLLLPIGQVAGLILGFFLVPMLGMRGWWRFATFGVAVAASFAVWFTPPSAIPEPANHTEWGFFLLGFVPTVLAGLAAGAIFRRLGAAT